MGKKDFVTAWLLAARTTDTHLTEEYVWSLVNQAERIWEALERRYEGELA